MTQPRTVRGPAVVPAGVKAQHRLAARHQTTHDAQRQQAFAEVPADMQVQHIIAQAKQKPHYLKCIPGIVDSVGVRTAVARDVDHFAGVALLAQVIANIHQVGLHAAMRRRKRPDLKDPHAVRPAVVLDMPQI
jgi:hypothetical protein